MRTLTFLVFILNIYYSQTVDQVREAKKVVKKMGLSEKEARKLAKDRGYSDEQIDKAIQMDQNQKVENVVNDFNSINDQSIDVSNSVVQSVSSENEIINYDEDQIDENQNNESKIAEIENQINYFGYDIFNKDPALFQQSSVGAIDPNYLIGPSDEIIVMLWGETEFRQVLKVNREGFVFISDVGQIFVNGLNLKLLESKLFRVYSKAYASLDPDRGEPTSFLDISLGNLRPLRIQVLGQINQPGAYTISPSTTLFSSLYYFNGPSISGSLRDIKLIRDNDEIASIDFYDYLLRGKKPKDQRLQLDDIIFIPNRKKTVQISGEVVKPGIYELTEEELLNDLLEIAGGLKVSAYLKRAQVDRIVPFEMRDSVGLDRKIIDIDLDKVLGKEKDFKIFDGDKIKIFSILDSRTNIVTITGAVTRPGTYELEKELDVLQLIEKADGILGDVFMERVDIFRTNDDLTEEIIKLNLESILNNDLNENITLQSMDNVRIYSLTEMAPQKYVTLDGHVAKPGRYKLLKGMKISDLLFLGGGFMDEDFFRKVYKERADLKRMAENNINQFIIPFNVNQIIEDQNNESNIELKSGDRVTIFSNEIFNDLFSVTIQGAIKNPGKYSLTDKMTIKDLLINAGGVNSNVFQYKIEIARVDPLNESEISYAKLIELDMLADYSISYTDSNQESLSVENKNFYLEKYDIVTVRANPFFSIQKNVTIDGAVYYPGEFSILSSEETIFDVIERAGGLKKNAYAESSTLIRNEQKVQIDFKKIIKNKKSKENIIIRPFDRIVISERPNIVSIRGEVNAPGIFKYQKGERIKDLIRKAGGLTEDANKENITILLPNGVTRKYRTLFGNHNVVDGSSVFVGRKKEEEPFDRTEYAKDITSIIADLAQAISLVILAKL